jgi:hypothetical protein
VDAQAVRKLSIGSVECTNAIVPAEFLTGKILRGYRTALAKITKPKDPVDQNAIAGNAA